MAKLTGAVDAPLIKPTSGIFFNHLNEDGTIQKTDLFKVVKKSDVWNFKGLKIITLAGVQKLAEYESIVEKRFQTEIVPSSGNKQQHAVNIWVGYKGDDNPNNWKRASGEASMLNTGKVTVDKDGVRKYEEFSAIDSKYRYAMADKRAFCRAVFKLIQLYGVCADAESADFEKKFPDIVDGYDY